MIKHLLIAIVLSIVMIGCSERYGGPIFPVPSIPAEHPSVPSDAQVLIDLQEAYRADCEYRGRIRGHQRRVPNLHCPGRQRL